MFKGLINDAKSAASSLVAKYLARASVAVPFVIAAGFAVAALAHILIARFGAVTGCWLMAGGFTLIGLLATLVVTVKEQEEKVADDKAEEADTAGVAKEAAEAAFQAPLALAGAFFSTPLGPGAVAGGARAVARNLPLVLLLALIAFLFWPADERSESETVAEGDRPPAPEPNGAYREAHNGLYSERAA